MTDTALTRAIDTYDQSLTTERAEESSTWLTAQLDRRGLFFGDRPLCTVLRPRFLTVAQYELLKSRIAPLLKAFNRAQSAALRDRGLLRQFRLTETEEQLLSAGLVTRAEAGRPEPRPMTPSPVSRLDAFFDAGDGSLRFTEYNAETPAGAAYGDVLQELFLALPGMQDFLTRYDVRPLPTRHNVLHALLRAYHLWLGRRETPTIGILDWKEVPTYSEFILYQQYFESMGVPCVIADVREVEYARGALFGGGRQIHLIYKRILINELLERGGLDHPIVRAVRDGAVCMVNPFACKVLHKKASLAVLSDERNRSLFGRDELAVIDAHVPWTRVVEERWTEHRRDRVDLVPFLHANRERMVLKPNDDYGGAGIVLGWEVTEDVWSRSVQAALTVPFIAQERIGLPRETYPSFADGQLHFADRIVDTAPFVFGGTHVDGCLTRVSTATLVNVTAGGGSTVPTFVVEPR